MTKEFNTEYMSRSFTSPTREKSAAAKVELAEIEIDKIKKFHTGDGYPFEVEEDAAIEKLRDSIKENGILEPVLVRPDKNFSNCYELIDGHRRLYAAESLGIKSIKARIDGCDDGTAVEIILNSNGCL